MESSTPTENSFSRHIETPRLYLRQFTPDDLDELYSIYSDSEVMKYLTEVRTREATASAVHTTLKRWESNNSGR